MYLRRMHRPTHPRSRPPQEQRNSTAPGQTEHSRSCSSRAVQRHQHGSRRGGEGKRAGRAVRRSHNGVRPTSEHKRATASVPNKAFRLAFDYMYQTPRFREQQCRLLFVKGPYTIKSWSRNSGENRRDGRGTGVGRQGVHDKPSQAAAALLFSLQAAVRCGSVLMHQTPIFRREQRIYYNAVAHTHEADHGGGPRWHA